MTDESERARGLFEGAFDGGEISEGSATALTRSPGILPAVAESLGAKESSAETLLVSVLVDDSGSIGPEHAPAVRDGHNRMIQAAARHQSTAAVSFHTRYFTKGLLSPYRPVAATVALTPQNYTPDAGYTPLYEQSVVILGSVIAKARELASTGCRVRTFTLLLTDGLNNSGTSTANDVKCLVTDMLEFANNHIVAGMGIGDAATFRQVFNDMGIPDRWILTAASTDQEIDATFRRIERSLTLAAASELEFHLQLEAGPAEG
jgi:hypothetical protein